jgi:FhuF 2Fe-2S C-terminal domain
VSGWATTAELAGPRLDDALATCGASLQTDRPDIQGQRLIEVVTWLLAVPVATALINETPLPDLAPDNVELWIGDEPPDGNGLRCLDERTAHEAHLDAHLEPLIAAVNAATKRPAKALWRAAKDRQDGAIAWIAETTNQRPRAFDLLEHRNAELRMLDLGTHEMLLHVREGCCLYYRTPANVKCFSCPLLDDEQRRRLSGAA